MRPSITRWLDWALSRARQAIRRSPRLLQVVIRHQKAGQTFVESPIPWNADLLELEATCRLPLNARRRGDFTLRVPGGTPVQVESMVQEHEDRHRLIFRFLPPTESLPMELCYKSRRIALVQVPILSSGSFAAGLQVSHATVAVRLGRQSIAAPRFVARQARGFVASAVITSPTPLAPLADGEIRVVFRHEPSGVEHSVPVRLGRSQLRSREATVTAVLPRQSRFRGSWLVLWIVNGEVKASKRIQGARLRRFHGSLRVLDSKFVVAVRGGEVKVVNPLPSPGEIERLGPCFLLSTGNPGIAGLCRLTIHATFPDQPPVCVAHQDVLLSDGGTVLAPVLLEAIRFIRCTGFELRHRLRVLATLSLSPVPRAALTAEGGFKPPPDFAWSTTAEEELQERLQRLMKGPF